IINGVLAPAGTLTLSETPLRKITNAHKVLAQALKGVPTNITTPAQVKTVKKLLEGPTSSVGKAIDDGRKAVDPTNQVAAQVAAVKNVYAETTNYGTVRDRTAEGAAYEEIDTGKPVGEDTYHGHKCINYADNLKTIISTIDLQLKAFPPQFHEALKQARADAVDREKKLRAGGDAWFAHQRANPGFGVKK
ncbi:MAG TPA: hypothetical protein VH969_25580, partial [Actinophytocola sp.]|uniref:hypothetical protein n=1 Tax=Actinophytocola sp. TaxID=1872138 RepID=UPI002F9295D3